MDSRSVGVERKEGRKTDAGSAARAGEKKRNRKEEGGRELNESSKPDHSGRSSRPALRKAQREEFRRAGGNQFGVRRNSFRRRKKTAWMHNRYGTNFRKRSCFFHIGLAYRYLVI